MRVHPFATPYVGEKPKPMKGRRIFSAQGIAAMLWLADKGSFALSEAVRFISRKDYGSVSIIHKGSFQMTEFPEGSGPWPVCTPGTICSEVSGDFLPGLYRYDALEDDSRELCLGGVDSKGWLDHGRFVYGKVNPGICAVMKGSVLVVATGHAVVPGLLPTGHAVVSPTFLSAEKNSIEVDLKGEGMWIARCS